MSRGQRLTMHGRDHRRGGADAFPGIAWTSSGGASGGGPYRPITDGFSGGPDGDGYINWGVNAGWGDPTYLIKPDPGDARIVMFPGDVTGDPWPPPAYMITVVGTVDPDTTMTPFKLKVFALKGDSGSWVKVVGPGGFPGSQLGPGSAAICYKQNFSRTDQDPVVVEFWYDTYHSAGGHNGIVVQYDGTAPAVSSLDLTITQIAPSGTQIAP